MDEEFTLKENKQKNQVLDESFKKAEVSRRLQSTYSKGPDTYTHSKSTPKSGLFLIIVAIISLICIYFGPWAFVSYDADYGSNSLWIFNNAQTNDLGQDQKMENLFGTPNYIGVTIYDFSSAPQSTTRGFLSLIILGLIFVIFQIINKFLKFSDETFAAVHSLFAGINIIISMYIVLSVVRFIGAYFIIPYNAGLIDIEKGILLFIIPILIVIIAFIIIKVSYAIIKINFIDLEKKKKIKKVQHSFFSVRKGGRFQ